MFVLEIRTIPISNFDAVVGLKLEGLVDVVYYHHPRKRVVNVFEQLGVLLLDVPLHKTEVLHLEVASRKTALPIKSELKKGFIGVDALDDPVSIWLLACGEHPKKEVWVQTFKHLLYPRTYFQFLQVISILLSRFLEMNQSFIQV